MPTLTVLAGPNGSGKSTLSRFVELEGNERLLDPDAIARDLNPLDPSAAAIAAGREVLKRTADFISQRVSFVVETTLSSPGRIALIRRAKAAGFEVHFYFVALGSPELSIQRIQNRVAKGGHFVPDEDVRRRYARSIANVPEAIGLADLAYLYDNSEGAHRLVLVAHGGVVTWRAARLPAWVPV